MIPESTRQRRRLKAQQRRNRRRALKKRRLLEKKMKFFKKLVAKQLKQMLALDKPAGDVKPEESKKTTLMKTSLQQSAGAASE